VVARPPAPKRRWNKSLILIIIDMSSYQFPVEAALAGYVTVRVGQQNGEQP
jgi:hypothetical protein